MFHEFLLTGTNLAWGKDHSSCNKQVHGRKLNCGCNYNSYFLATDFPFNNINALIKRTNPEEMIYGIMLQVRLTHKPGPLKGIRPGRFRSRGQRKRIEWTKRDSLISSYLGWWSSWAPGTPATGRARVVTRREDRADTTSPVLCDSAEISSLLDQTRIKECIIMRDGMSIEYTWYLIWADNRERITKG